MQLGLYCSTPYNYYYSAAESLLTLHRLPSLKDIVLDKPDSKLRDDDSVGGDKFLGDILGELQQTNLLDLALNYVDRALQLLNER